LSLATCLFVYQQWAGLGFSSNIRSTSSPWKERIPRKTNSGLSDMHLLYHSLDVKTGRSVYMLLNGNSKLAVRLEDATRTHRHDLCASAPRTPEQAFVGSLLTHSIIAEWAVENWREYIDDLDDMLQSLCAKVRVAPVMDAPSGFAAPFSPRRAEFSRPPPLRTEGSRQGVFRTASSRKSTTYREASQSDACNPVVSEAQSSAFPRSTGYQITMRFLRRLFGLRIKPKQGHTEIAGEPDKSIQRLDAPASQFSFKGLQRLSLNRDEIDQALSAFDQNMGIFDRIEEEYRELPESYAFKKFLKKEQYDRDLATFLRRIRALRQELGLQRLRLVDMSRTIENDIHIRTVVQVEPRNQLITIQTPKPHQTLAQASIDEESTNEEDEEASILSRRRSICS